jgi:hypothetical protein
MNVYFFSSLMVVTLSDADDSLLRKDYINYQPAVLMIDTLKMISVMPDNIHKAIFLSRSNIPISLVITGITYAVMTAAIASHFWLL